MQYFLTTRNQFYFWLFFLFPILAFLAIPIGLGDLTIWIALGRDALIEKKLIWQDPYTVAETVPMIYPFILSFIYGCLHQWMGLHFVVLLHALIPGFWVVIWCRFLKFKTRSDQSVFNLDIWSKPVILIFSIVMMGVTLVLIPRPALVATIPFLLSYFILASEKADPLRIASALKLILIEIFWVNVHGSFLILPLMIFWQAFGFLIQRKASAFWNRLLVAIPVLAATLFNPAGWKMYPYIFETAQLSKDRRIDEWFPPHEFYYPTASLTFFIVSAALLIGMIWSMRKLKRSQNFDILFDPFLLVWLSGFLAVRNTFLMYLLLPIFLFNTFQFRVGKDSDKSKSLRYSNLLNSGILLLFIGSLIALSPYFKSRWSTVLPEDYRATFAPEFDLPRIHEHLKQNQGSIFNSWNFGSDLALHQPNKYFIDTRNIIFTKSTFDEYDSFITDPEKHQSILDKYQFRFLLISDRHQDLISWIERSGQFQMILKEGPATLFERKPF